MQALLHDLTAEQPGEEAHAAEEDSHAQIENLERVGQHPRVFLDAAVASHGTVSACMRNHYRRARRPAGRSRCPRRIHRVFLISMRRIAASCASPQLPGQFLIGLRGTRDDGWCSYCASSAADQVLIDGVHVVVRGRNCFHGEIFFHHDLD